MPADTLKISILIAAYNAQETIKRCLDSCLNQTYQNFEVIVVNDGSQDATAAIVQAYATRDSRITLVNIENRGQGRARNIGMNISTGSYVTILDADDTLDASALRDLTTAATPETDVVIANWRRFDTHTQQTHYKPIFGDKIGGIILPHQKSSIIASTYFSVGKLYRRAFLITHNIRFGEGYIYEDMEFLLGAVLHANQTVVVPHPVYTVHAGPTSSTKVQTQSDWHARSFISAVQSTITQYAHLLHPYRKHYTFYVLNRAQMYTAKTNRIPRSMWRAFLLNILRLISTLYEDTPTPENASKRYALVVRTFKQNEIAGCIVFQVTHWFLKLRRRP